MKKIFLKDFIKLQRGFDLPRKDMINGPYPVVGSTSIVGYHNKYKMEPPGVVTGRSGSLGVIQYIKEKYWPHNTSLWVKDFKDNFPRYVYYYLKILNLERFNSGAGVPTLNRNDLDKLEIYIHEYDKQKIVAQLLADYDDLIEINNRRIKILEEMAQLIYKEWFVKFRFPRHEQVKMIDSDLGKIPEGWSYTKIPDYVFFQEGPGLRKWQWTEFGMKVINVKNILKSGDIDTSNTKRYISYNEFNKKYKHFMISEGDIVIASSGNTYGKIGKILKYHLPLMMNTSVIRFRSKNNDILDQNYLYWFLRSDFFKQQIENFVIGSAQPNFGPSHLKMMKILVLPKIINDMISQTFRPINRLVDVLKEKNKNLKICRDLLLPKLISGEINIK